ncbi:MAG: hypothetical protein KGL39_06565 [Patescibacteria group bacterium]|nr:hypothetical protein [Patescibacteria group bacterium]
MMEPTIIAQTAECHTDDEKRAWIERQCAYGKDRGVVFVRVTQHDNIPDLLLYEGWTARPENQGEPRFQFTAT